MTSLRPLFVAVLILSVFAYGQGNSWDRVRYNGGTIQTKVDPKDWSNHLTVTSDVITLKLKDGQNIEIRNKQVTGLSYGQEAHRRVGTMIGLALISPVALFGLFHKTRLHFIGIEYVTPDEKKSGVLLQGDKDNYRAILLALHSATNAPLTVSDKDREFVPTGIQASVVKGPETGAAASVGSVAVTSNPAGGEVYVDGSFEGNAPAALKLTPGKHSVRITTSGYKDWSRDIQVEAGSQLNLIANMEYGSGSASSASGA